MWVGGASFPASVLNYRLEASHFREGVMKSQTLISFVAAIVMAPALASAKTISLPPRFDCATDNYCRCLYLDYQTGKAWTEYDTAIKPGEDCQKHCLATCNTSSPDFGVKFSCSGQGHNEVGLCYICDPRVYPACKHLGKPFYLPGHK